MPQSGMYVALLVFLNLMRQVSVLNDSGALAIKKGGYNMFNYKFAFSRSKSLDKDFQKLPADFGSMYFLYPTESVDFFKFKPISLMDKIFSIVKEKLKRSDVDFGYYKNYGV